jgi:uncharacterized repeat protein (TIGR02543 family)
MTKMIKMHAQNETNAKADASLKLRRLTTAIFIVCLLVSLALLGVNFGEGGVSRLAYAAGDPHPEWDKYNSSEEAGLGDGGWHSPYLIGNAKQLKDLANKVNATQTYTVASNMSGKFIKLTANIDLSAYGADASSGYFDGKGWNPIGNYSTAAIVFSGDFDGGGFEISGLYINIETNGDGNIYAGLFGHIKDAAISNLSVSGRISAKSNTNGRVCAGGIAGYCDGATTVTGSYNTGAVTASVLISSSVCVGGILGCFNGTNNTITGSYNTGDVTLENVQSGNYVGGILGYFNGTNNTITDSHNTGDVTVSGKDGNHAGGILGYCNSGTTNTSNSYNTGIVTAKSETGSFIFAGGILGYCNSGTTTTISNSYNSGIVTAKSETGSSIFAGGILGNGAATITDSHNTGDVTASGANGSYAGGISGYATSVRNSYNTGIVTAKSETGSGINAGGITNTGNVSGSYNTGAVTAKSETGSGISAGGITNNGNVSGSYNTGAVTAKSETGSGINAGGITNNGNVSGSYNTGAVTAKSEPGTGIYAGGISGYGTSVSNSYNTGTVTVTGWSFSTGGIIGQSNSVATITDSYNTGAVEANAPYADGTVQVGGIAGYCDNITVSRSYNAGTVGANSAGIVYVGGIAGRIGTGSITATNSYYDKGSCAGGYAVGDKPSMMLNTGLSIDQMIAADTLMPGGAMSGLGGAFSKRPPVKANGIVYYPELKAFADSPNPEIADASRIGAATSETFAPNTPEPVYKITYAYQGATGGERRFDLVEYGHAFELAVPTRTRYIFLGWFDEASGGIRYADENGKGDAWSIAGDITLYAQWEPCKYAVTYINGGDANPNPTTYEFGVENPLAPATRTGYTFDGWYADAGFTGAAITTIAAGSDAPKTFYAKWIANTYTVSYNVNGGEGATARGGKYEYGTAYTLIQNEYTRAGYVFTGWNTASDGSGRSYKNEEEINGLTDMNGGIVTTLYAQWAKVVNSGGAEDIVGGVDGGSGFDLAIPLLAGVSLLLLIGVIALLSKRKKRAATRRDAAAAVSALKAGFATQIKIDDGGESVSINLYGRSKRNKQPVREGRSGDREKAEQAPRGQDRPEQATRAQEADDRYRPGPSHAYKPYTSGYRDAILRGAGDRYEADNG